MTKKEYRTYKANWQKALAEGRVINTGLFFKEYLTAEAAQEALVSMLAQGISAHIVKI